MSVVESIKNHEGFRDKPYPDPLTGGEPYTFGYGFTSITENEADLLLTIKVNSIRSQLRNNIIFFEILPKNQQDVLVEMAYQLGINGLLSFKKFLNALGSQRIPEAVKEMKDSKWYKQTTNRVNDLIERLSDGNA